MRLSRNFGHQLALTAGLDAASGEAVVTMDGDLQHPPEVIPELVEQWRNGHAVVYAVMAERQGESRAKDVTARMFYRVLTRLTDVDVPAGAGDFRLVDRRALDAFLRCVSPNRYLRGMFSWVGFEQAGVPYVSGPRVAGRSKYTVRRMIRLAVDAIVGFSDRPLRIALNIGFLVSVAVGPVRRVGGGLEARGDLRRAGMDVGDGPRRARRGCPARSCSGIIGEYVGRISDEVKGRPLYIVRDAHGLRVDGGWR